MKRFLTALVIVAAMAVPALAAPAMTLRGIASGNHPFALVEIDHSTYLLGVGDTIGGKTIRSIGVRGVALNDGTVLHVSGGDEAPLGTTSLNTTRRQNRVASGEEDFYDNDTDVERPGDASFSGNALVPYYGGFGYAYPGLGYSGYAFDGYGYGSGYGSRYRRPHRPNGGAYGFGAGYVTGVAPGGYNPPGSGAPGQYNSGLTTYGRSRAR